MPNLTLTWSSWRRFSRLRDAKLGWTRTVTQGRGIAFLKITSWKFVNYYSFNLVVKWIFVEHQIFVTVSNFELMFHPRSVLLYCAEERHYSGFCLICDISWEQIKNKNILAWRKLHLFQLYIFEIYPLFICHFSMRMLLLFLFAQIFHLFAKDKEHIVCLGFPLSLSIQR